MDLILFILFSSLLFLYFYLSQTKPNSSGGFKSYPLVGSLPGFIKHRHRFLDWTTDVLATCPSNTSVFCRPGKIQGVMTANPRNVEHMLKTNFENYPKGERFRWLLHDFLGHGIFNADGDLWKLQRKTASYEFNTKSLRSFVIENVAIEIQSRLIPILKNAAHNQTFVDIQDMLERFAFDNVCKLAFNVDPACLGGDATTGSEFMKAFEDAATHSSGRFMYVFPLFWTIKKFFNIGSEQVLKNSISTVNDYALGIVRSRMEAKLENKDEDLLSRFMGNDEFSMELLRDIAISFILAGRDTTSSALTWFFWVMSWRPDVVETIRKELDVIRKRSGKGVGDSYSFDELREMNYLHAAISETLRLYPPVPVDTKRCENDDIMPDGTLVKKGWFATYNAYAMGRMESIWGKDCREFMPERWLDEGAIRQESPYRFPIFHGGPRMCLGKDMAYIQMKSIAACVIQLFDLEVRCKDKSPQHLLSLTLRIKGGLTVAVKQRPPPGST